MSVYHFLQFGAWDQSHLCLNDLAALKYHNRWKHGYTVFGSQCHVFIYIDFANSCLAVIVIRKLIDNWTQFSARASRRRPKIYQYRVLRLEHFCIKSIFC